LFSAIAQLLCKCPAEYLSAMNLAYADKHGITLSHMLGSELSGIAKEAAEFMFGMKVKPIEAVAKLINKAVCTSSNDTFIPERIV